MLQKALYIFFVYFPYFFISRAFCAIWRFQISYVCMKIRSLTIAIRRMYFHGYNFSLYFVLFLFF